MKKIWYLIIGSFFWFFGLHLISCDVTCRYFGDLPVGSDMICLFIGAVLIYETTKSKIK